MQTSTPDETCWASTISRIDRTCVSALSSLARSDDSQVSTPSTTRIDTRVPSSTPPPKHDDHRVTKPLIMSFRVLPNDNVANDPHVADHWSATDAGLNREYTLVDSDLTCEPEYDVIPDPKTTLVEKNPKQPPHPLNYYAADRSYTRELAERMGFWVSDPAARLDGGKQRRPDRRSDTDRASQKETEAEAWIDNIKNDIQCLWNNMGVGQDLLFDELQTFRESFFFVCRKKLEEIEKVFKEISLAQFQMEVRTLLVSLDLKLSEDGLKIMKYMATDKQVLHNQHTFTFEEHRDLKLRASRMIAQLSGKERGMLHGHLLCEMAPVQREMFLRQKLDPVRRHFSNRAINEYVDEKKKKLDEALDARSRM
ncbi:hypothetical protein AUEXF2481DRAFT_176519 [Aureobasidium subglaciale EXF-2481]|uniref:Uncharacterized protein n=1 Tax=Aureobasidium subglaciale (strain EXF-2481) TaxID=1043005 RepID=A0A074YP07_AURSE|nr:uncharacterized protein AUEXF2481DRAFT_176519 [Aureobasidium subglaciale EXF-2481]KEQ99425.1 hypothetical protein AUEXF2481DRAFT_176519 [Aureobasidium subglaciale EXF-2481]